MLAQRLEKLEYEIQFILAMSDHLLQNEEGDEVIVTGPKPRTQTIRRLFTDEIPEKDTTNNSRNRKSTKICPKGPRVATLASTVKESLGCTPQLPNVCGVKSSNVLESTLAEDIKSTSSQILENLGNDKDTDKHALAELLDKERKLRTKIEESAKQVYIRLQKVESDLNCEKQMKESLLLGTHQLKSLLHECDSKIGGLNAALTESKVETQRLTTQIQVQSSQNKNVLERLKSLCHALGLRKEYTQGDSNCQIVDSETCFQFIRSKIQQLIQNSSSEEATDEIHKLSSQLNICVERCEKLERECERHESELKKFQGREETLKNQVHISQVALSTLESELLKKQIDFECIIKASKCDSQLEKEKANAKIEECCAAIRRSKELLITLKKERDESYKKFREAHSIIHSWQERLKLVESDKQALQLELNKAHETAQGVTRSSMVKVEKLQGERLAYEENLRTVLAEKKRCMGLMGEMKQLLISFRNKYEHETAMFNLEKAKLVNENKRLDDNFRVVQKVSEDQLQTITKLRGDLEDKKSSYFRLETESRDREATQKELIRKLEHSNQQCEKYAKHVDHLEDKIERFEEYMQQHDCDDAADSKYRKKLKEVEELLQSEIQRCKTNLHQLEIEKNEASAQARKAQKETEELKQAHETKLAGIKSKIEAEVQKLHEQQKRQALEKSMKIQELQSELDRLKLSSSQIQRALSTKIQQLQAALSICLGGSNQNNNNSSLGSVQLLHHQLHPPATAFGNANGYCNTANNSSTGNLPNTGGLTTPTFFSESDIKGCTSGLGMNSERSTCPALEGLLGIDIDNLML